MTQARHEYSSRRGQQSYDAETVDSVNSFFVASKARRFRRTTVPQLAAEFDAPTLILDATPKASNFRQIDGSPAIEAALPVLVQVKLK
jgi:hypothetical protein